MAARERIGGGTGDAAAATSCTGDAAATCGTGDAAAATCGTGGDAAATCGTRPMTAVESAERGRRVFAAVSTRGPAPRRRAPAALLPFRIGAWVGGAPT